MQEAFDVELRGRLGTGEKDLTEITIFNRILRVDADGLTYETDPRHVELLARALGLEESKEVVTPVSRCVTTPTLPTGSLSTRTGPRRRCIT